MGKPSPVFLLAVHNDANLALFAGRLALGQRALLAARNRDDLNRQRNVADWDWRVLATQVQVTRTASHCSLCRFRCIPVCLPSNQLIALHCPSLTGNAGQVSGNGSAAPEMGLEWVGGFGDAGPCHG